MKDSFEQNFNQAFERYDETAMISQLREKIKPRSYYAKNKSWRIFLECLSWLMNGISVLAAGYFIYSSTSLLTGVQWVGILAGLIIIGAIEIIKRKSSHEFWQVWFFKRRIAKGWLCLSVLLFIISLLASAIGTKKGGDELAPDVELLKADSTLQAYKIDVGKLDKEVADLRANKDKNGTTFYNLNAAITAKTNSAENLRAEKIRLEKKLEGKNDQLTDGYKDEVRQTTWVLVFIVIGCEIIFECCVAYIWYFYFRSLVENGLSEGWLKNVADIYTMDENAIPSREHVTKPAKPKPPKTPKPTTEAKREAREHVTEDREHIAQHVTDDLYTVEHTYIKDGKEVKVRYAQSTIDSRVKQYSERLREAEGNEAHQKVIDNLTERLDYWLGKQIEIMEKLEVVEVA